MRDERIPGVAPWSFFLPVALAVLVGGVVAGLVLRGIDDRSGTGDADPIPASADSAAEEGQEMAEADEPPDAGDDEAREVPMPPEAIVSPDDARRVASSAPDGDAVAAMPSLPGAIVARRDGAPEACINGTIAWRDENGWQQRLENDAPVACVEASALAQ